MTKDERLNQIESDIQLIKEQLEKLGNKLSELEGQTIEDKSSNSQYKDFLKLKITFEDKKLINKKNSKIFLN